MLNDLPREKLKFIIEEYGRSAIRDANRCRELLRELAPENLREIKLLMLVLTQGFVWELTAQNLESIVQHLHDRCGTPKEFAFWAIQSWASALNIIQQTSKQKIIKPELENFFVEELIVTNDPQQIGKFIIEDGVATDTETGLMWLRFSYGQVWHNGKVLGIAERFNWDDAMDAVSNFNTQGGYKDYNDWRIPTIEDLKTLLEAKGSRKMMYLGRQTTIDAYMNYDVFPIDEHILNHEFALRFWSSSSSSNPKFEDVMADTVDFWFGRVNNFSKDFISSGGTNIRPIVRFVRCINLKTEAEKAECQVKREQKAKAEALQKIEATKPAQIKVEEQTEIARQEKLAIERKIEVERQEKLAAEQQVKTEKNAKTEALQKIDSAKQARIKAEGQTEIERKAKIEAQRKAEIARQEKLEAERTIESEKLKNEHLKTAHAQQLELEKERLKREFELEIEKLKIESEQKIKLELERFKVETIKTTEIIEAETILEVITVEVETEEKSKIVVPLLKDEATQDFEDMF